ncbi:MAG: hypothetical protein QXJ17_04240 [Nitrososphaeria archaeon]
MKTIVYDVKFEEAKEALKHEFIEYLVDRSNKPYRDLINICIDFFQDQAHLEREKIVKALSNLMLFD